MSADDLTARLRDAGITVEAIAPVAPSLEDVFLDVVDRLSNPEQGERERRVTHADGAGPGAPASARAGEAEGRRPSGTNA